MKQSRKRITKAMAWAAALLMMAASPISVSAAETVAGTNGKPKQVTVLIPWKMMSARREKLNRSKQLLAADQEESDSKQVLPPKEKKVTAEQDYKTHTSWTIQYQCPASWEKTYFNDEDCLVYENEHLYVCVSVYSVDEPMGQFRDELEALISEEQERQDSLGDLFDMPKYAYLNPSRNLKGIETRFAKDEYYFITSILYGKDDALQISIMTDELGRDAAEEYRTKILNSVKTIPIKSRTVIRKDIPVY